MVIQVISCKYELPLKSHVSVFSSAQIIIVKPLKGCQIIPSAPWYF